MNDLDSGDAAERTAATLIAEQGRRGRRRTAGRRDFVRRRAGDGAWRRWTASEGVHILVNNAGVLRPTAVIDIEEEEWDFVVGVNLKGTYLCSRAVLPAMREAGWGRIVNFSSTAGKNVQHHRRRRTTRRPRRGCWASRATWPRRRRANGITVNSVCPGLIDTEMVRSTIDDERAKAYAASFPISRLGEPEEVAELVAFLASDR